MTKKYREYFLMVGKRRKPPQSREEWYHTKWKGWALERRRRFRELGCKSEIYGVTRLENGQILLEVIK